jgi:hypothetical protein
VIDEAVSEAWALLVQDADYDAMPGVQVIKI